MGGVISATTIASVMSGCQRDISIDWIPQFFSPDQAKIVNAMVETILPTTELPGAKEAGVGSYIDLTVKNHLDSNRKAVFIKGLNTFISDCRAEYGKRFDGLSHENQYQLLERLDKESHAIMDNKPSDPNTPTDKVDWSERPFFRNFKELTLAGYFSSEVVAKQFFKYEQIPGGFEGCASGT